MDSFRAIIDLWSSAETLARDLAVPGVTVRAWRRRDRIPAEHWSAVIAAAGQRGMVGVTVENLAALSGRARRAPDAAA